MARKNTWFVYLNLGKNVRVLTTLRFHLKNPYQPTLETLSFNEISELYEQAFTRDIVYTFVTSEAKFLLKRRCERVHATLSILLYLLLFYYDRHKKSQICVHATLSILLYLLLFTRTDIKMPNLRSRDIVHTFVPKMHICDTIHATVSIVLCLPKTPKTCHIINTHTNEQVEF